MTLQNTESMLSHEAFTVGGPHKGYRGHIKLVVRNFALIELPGLAEGSKVCYIVHKYVVLRLVFCYYLASSDTCRLTNCNLLSTKHFILPRDPMEEAAFEREKTPLPDAEETNSEEYSRFWKTKDP